MLSISYDFRFYEFFVYIVHAVYLAHCNFCGFCKEQETSWLATWLLAFQEKVDSRVWIVSSSLSS